MKKLNKMIEAVTGLDISSPDAAEDYQIANYGIGGHYVPHYDLIDFEKELHGRAPQTYHHVMKSRIATFMIYVSYFEVLSFSETAKKNCILKILVEDLSIQRILEDRFAGIR